MNREQATALIRQTFTHAFDKPGFHNFTLNLLNSFDESKAFARNSFHQTSRFTRVIGPTDCRRRFSKVDFEFNRIFKASSDCLPQPCS